MTALLRRYEKLDELPKALRGPVVAHLGGRLEDRIDSIVTFRTALLRGALPRAHEIAWPTEPALGAILDALTESGVVPLCKGQPEITDEVLMTLLEAVITSERFAESATAHFLSLAIVEEANRQRIELPPRVVSDPSACCRCGGLVFDEETLARVKRDAQRLAMEMACKKAGLHVADWKERVEAIVELGALLEAIAPRGWDLSHAALHVLGKTDMVRVRALLAHLRQLEQMLIVLGRHLRSPLATESTIFERVSGPMRRPVVKQGEQLQTFEPDLRSVERADDVARMLPSEAASLLHPQLRLVWHARRAERALLCYHAQGSGPITVEEQTDDGETQKRSKSDRGPLIVCMDTSGSMAGSPATLAQALVLHVALVAHEEGRRCHVFSFSGPGDVVEHTLGFDAEGMEGVLTFLLLAFAGGTDVSEPIRRALDKHEEVHWKNADLLIVSDGEFAPPVTLVPRLRKEKASTGLRAHGVLLGTQETALRSFCDEVHRMRDWVNEERS